MTSYEPQRSARPYEALRRTGTSAIACDRTGTSAIACARLASAVLVLLVGAGCTPTTYSVLRDPPDYVDHVLEDVTAIVEGMAMAHAKDRVVYRDPGLRSSLKPTPDR